MYCRHVDRCDGLWLYRGQRERDDGELRPAEHRPNTKDGQGQGRRVRALIILLCPVRRLLYGIEGIGLRRERFKIIISVSATKHGHIRSGTVSRCFRAPKRLRVSFVNQYGFLPCTLDDYVAQKT